MKKNPSLTPTQDLNDKKSRHLECFSLPIGGMYFWLLLVTIFGLG
jgi:hypothetical protein